jgi:sugar phosphate permease
MLNIDRIRTILNIIFMIGALSTIVVYFTVENQMVMFIVCCFTIFVKFIEYALRFTQNSLNQNKRRKDNE